MLGRALESMRSQSPPPAEVLVVDNAPPDDATRRLVMERFPEVRYVLEPRPGLDVARNRALAEARRDVVAFLDDDAVAEPGWTGALDAAFRREPRLAVCMGRILPGDLDTPGQRLFEDNGGFDRGEHRILLPDDSRRRRLRGFPAPLVAWSISVGSGCSMAMRRATIAGIGGFDETLDAGPSFHGGGDLDLVWRALEAGHAVLYDPDARVRHEHRRDIDAAIRQIQEHHRSLVAFLVKSVVRSRGTRRAGVVAFLAWRILKPALRTARATVARDPLPLSALIGLCGSTWSGVPAGLRHLSAREKS